MQGDDVRKMFKGMNYSTLKSVRDAASKELNYQKSKLYIKEQVYIPAHKRADFDIAKEWAIRNGLVKRPTNWSFVQMCALNTIDLIAKQARAERIALGGVDVKDTAAEAIKKAFDERTGDLPSEEEQKPA